MDVGRSKSAAIVYGDRNKMNGRHPEIKKHLSKLTGVSSVLKVVNAF